jgi:GAF domain-containing protein
MLSAFALLFGMNPYLLRSMIPAPLPTNETTRLHALAACDIMETPREEWFEVIIQQAVEMSGAPVAFLALVDEKREWFKASHGLALKEAPREYSFCAFAILHPDQLMEVQDARYDERFHDNPLTTGATRIVYYAGMPIVDADGYALGALALADKRPRQLSDHKLLILETLARLVSTRLELRKIQRQLREFREEK